MLVKLVSRRDPPVEPLSPLLLAKERDDTSSVRWLHIAGTLKRRASVLDAKRYRPKRSFQSKKISCNVQFSEIENSVIVFYVWRTPSRLRELLWLQAVPGPIAEDMNQRGL